MTPRMALLPQVLQNTRVDEAEVNCLNGWDHLSRREEGKGDRSDSEQQRENHIHPLPNAFSNRPTLAGVVQSED